MNRGGSPCSTFVHPNDPRRRPEEERASVGPAQKRHRDRHAPRLSEHEGARQHEHCQEARDEERGCVPARVQRRDRSRSPGCEQRGERDR